MICKQMIPKRALGGALLLLSLLGWAGGAARAADGQKAVHLRRVPNRALFVDTVWKVRVSRQVAPGQLYVFLSEGTLVIASARNKPAFGSWTYKNGALTMTEEGRPYRAEIVRLTRNEFRLKIHNPGTPVEMTLVPAHAGM